MTVQPPNSKRVESALLGGIVKLERLERALLVEPRVSTSLIIKGNRGKQLYVNLAFINHSECRMLKSC